MAARGERRRNRRVLNKPLPVIAIEACMCPSCQGNGPYYLTVYEARRLGFSMAQIFTALDQAKLEGRLSIRCSLEPANPPELPC